MSSRQRLLSILIGLAGASGSVLALFGFLLKMMRNGLDPAMATTPQAFYRSVGTAYCGGFTAGFSLCFFLALIAVAVGTRFEHQRSTAARGTESVRIPLVRPGPQG